MGSYKIVWSTQAKQDLKDIYKYWEKKSVLGAKNVRSDILNSPKTIYYAKQYQIDDINPQIPKNSSQDLLQSVISGN